MSEPISRHFPSLRVTVLVPVFHEAPVLPELLARLAAVAAASPTIGFDWLFVDDGSTDGSREWLRALAQRDPRTTLIELSRNFGKEAAMSAGFDHAEGDAVVVIDADLQDPPELIPAMVDAWREGAQVVLMRRRSRAGETRFKRTSAHLFYRLLNRLADFDIPEDVGDFRLLARAAVAALITVLGGVQLFSLGIVGIYVGKAYLEAKRRPLYVVSAIHAGRPGMDIGTSAVVAHLEPRHAV